MFRWILVLSLTVACGGKGGESRPLRVAAAASLAVAFVDVAAAFEKQTRTRVEITPGSSGKLAAQIAEGAPFDVFASAAESFVTEVVDNGSAIGDSRVVYAVGRLVVWSPPGQRVITNLEDLRDPQFSRIALANPELAPYGEAARAALTHVGIWSSLEPRIVYGGNVAAALQLAATGNAEASMTALSLVIDDKKQYLLVDDALHPPLSQSVVILKEAGDNPRARAFVDFLTSAQGRVILSRYGLFAPRQTMTH